MKTKTRLIQVPSGQTRVTVTITGAGPLAFTIYHSDETKTFVLGGAKHILTGEHTWRFSEEIRRADLVDDETVHEYRRGGELYRQYALLPALWLEVEHEHPFTYDLAFDAAVRQDPHLVGLELV